MNQLISYNDAAGVLCVPAFPKMARPDFPSVRALHKHLHRALVKLDCPQSRVYGWTGLAMDPTMYAMIETIPFAIPNDPGPTPTYTAGFQSPQQMRTPGTTSVTLRAASLPLATLRATPLRHVMCITPTVPRHIARRLVTRSDTPHSRRYHPTASPRPRHQ